MSTLAYAALTTRREASPPGQSKSAQPPGVKGYVDAMAALVPAEVLTLHGLILTVTTTVADRQTTISNPGALAGAFYGLIAFAIILYVAPRWRSWDNFDYFRALIPPVSFVAWTMLQRSTAFDAVAPKLNADTRSVIALFIAAIIGFLATQLADKADKKPAGS